MSPAIYSSVVWAVLVSSVTSPLMLLQAIGYFNRKQAIYLAEMNPLKYKEARTADGKMHLHLHIHVKSRVQWSMHEKFQQVLEDLGLEIVVHTTDHQRGVNAVVDTNMYVIDERTLIDVPTIQKQREIRDAIMRAPSRPFDVIPSERLATHDLEFLHKSENLSERLASIFRDVHEESEFVEARQREVQMALLKVIDLDDAVVTVTEWTPWNWSKALDQLLERRGEKRTVEFFMRLFDEIDMNKSGTVGESELYEALQKHGVRVTRDNLSAMIAMVDIAGDGVISRDEWRHAIDFYMEKRIGSGTVENGSSLLIEDSSEEYSNFEKSSAKTNGGSTQTHQTAKVHEAAHASDITDRSKQMAPRRSTF